MRKSLSALFIAALLASASTMSWADNASIDAQIANAKEMSEFSDQYHQHLVNKEKNKNMRRGKFRGNFTFYSQGCTDPNGAKGFSAFAGKSSGGGNTNNYVSGSARAGSTLGTPMRCDCPVNNNYLSCMKSAQALVEYNSADIGGIGYVLIFADDGKSNFVLIDHKWQPIHALKTGKATFITENVSRFQTYDIDIDKSVCGNSGGVAIMGGVNTKTYSIYAGYGVADTMDIKYVDMALKSDLVLDRKEYMWSAARLDGFSTKNSQLIGTVTCK